MPTKNLPRILKPLLLSAGLVGCVPTHAGFLRVPVKVAPAHPGGPVIVRVPFAAIESRLDDFDPQQATYFFRGRTPLPFAYVDTDSDGAADTLVVKLPAGEPRYWIVVVSTGERTARSMPEGGSAEGVTLDLDGARN